MALTPNYSFIIPTGTDAVNLLTQCYPNFSSLDTLLKPIQESGVTVATDTKVGTVHQLVRTDSSCNMFRFIATANYASGDTFTVDGASVTATAMDGTALPGGAFVINQSVVCVLNNLVLTVMIAGKETTSLAASAVTYDNTVSGLTATNAQDAIDELQSEIASIPTPPADHGLYELWANPNPTNAFGAQSVILNSFDSTKWDAVEIEFAIRANESMGVKVVRYEKAGLVGGTLSSKSESTYLSAASGKILYQERGVTFTLAGTTLTITFTDTSYYALATYGVAPTSSTENDMEVPVRILGLAHNS